MKEFKKQRRESCYESGTLKISKVEGLVRRREMMKICKEMPQQFINTIIIYENTRIDSLIHFTGYRHLPFKEGGVFGSDRSPRSQDVRMDV